MKTKFSSSWKASIKPSKQRKYRAKAPLHIKRNLLQSHLSKDLRGKYKKRSIALRKGDKVLVMRGSFRKHQGKVDKVDMKRTRIFVSGAEAVKRDGSKRPIALHPSNLMIVELNLNDKIRAKSLEVKNG